MPTLGTERLVLRTFEPSDAVDVFAYAQSPTVGPMAGWQPHRGIEESRRIVQLFIRNRDVWAIVEKKTGRVIGSIGLHADGKRNVNGAKTLGYVLGESYWNQGFATEASREVLRYAFEELNCPIVSVEHFPKNAKSKHVIKKLGFTYEGTLRMSYTLYDGTVLDELLYSMTRAEYDKQTEATKEAGKCRP